MGKCSSQTKSRRESESSTFTNTNNTNIQTTSTNQKRKKNYKIESQQSFSGVGNQECFQNIKNFYKLGSVIGSGGFGQVRICTKIGDETQKLFAVKSIFKQKAEKDIIKEVKVLITLDHPSIIKFYEYFVDDEYFHLVTELCTGGELVNKIQESPIPEKQASSIIWKILSAIAYCHSNEISHRDLKPENIMFETNADTDETEIKIIDFNLSKDNLTGSNMKSVIGTPYYMAPEVILGDYNRKCDVWSIGIISYFMLCGQQPFYDGKTIFNVYNKILREEPEFKEPVWETISPEIIDFIKQCLIKDTNLRPSAKDLFVHPLFKSVRENIVNNHCTITLKSKLENLKNFNHSEKFKKMVLKCIVENVVSSEELKKLREIFYSLDLDHTGYINVSELQEAFTRVNLQVTDEELQLIIEKCDDKKNGKIDYTEFLVGSVDDFYLNKVILKYVFDLFDIDKSGKICTEDLRKMMHRCGESNKSKDEIEELIKEVTQDDKVKINFDDLCNIFKIKTKKQFAIADKEE